MRITKLSVLLILCVFVRANAADFDIRDEAEFKKIIPDSAKVEKLATGFKFVEGPTWIKADGGYLIFSDIPANEIKKWTAKDGVTTFRTDSHGINGNTLDTQGRIVSAQHTSRSVTRTEADGKITTLVDNFNGKPFNSPNDVVVKSDGSIWFTDPDYGLPRGQKKEQDGDYVYRLDPLTKDIQLVAKGFNKPNGLCFSPDEKRLYVADSGQPRHIRVFDVKDDGTLAGGGVFCKIDKGGPDGIRCDADGRVWSSAGDGVHVFTPSGTLVAKILVPETPANLCFGGDGGKTLFITAQKSLYSIKTNMTQASNTKQ